MVIEIDFEKKIITLRDNVKLGELVEKLKGLELGDWNGWEVKACEKTIELIPTTPSQPWIYPYIYPPYPPYPLDPIYHPIIVSPGTFCSTEIN